MGSARGLEGGLGEAGGVQEAPADVEGDPGGGGGGWVMEKLSVDEMLQKWVGEMGRAQLWHFTVVSFAWTVHGLQNFVMIFADRDPAWQCVTPAPFPSDYTITGSSNACTPSSSICAMERSSWEWVGGKGVSTVAEWDLICGDQYKKGLAQTVFFMGLLCGAGLFGTLSDSKLGRKRALALACSLTSILGMSTATAQNYWMYLTIRILTGITTGGVGLTSFVLATEPIGPSRRGQAGMSAFYFFSFGIMAVPVFSSWTTTWRALYIQASLPAVLYCLLVLPFVFESPRWYLVHGRLEEAMAVLRSFATLNGKFVPEWVGLRTDFITTANQARNDSATREPLLLHELTAPIVDEKAAIHGIAPQLHHPMSCGGTLVDVIRCPTTRWRLVIMSGIWFCTTIIYYGINFNIVNMGFNIYVGVFINGAIEIPAYFITALLLGKVGRRMLLSSAMVLTGICCLVDSLLFNNNTTMSMTSAYAYASTSPTTDIDGLNFTNPNLSISGIATWRLVCAVVGVFGIAGAYNLIYIYTLELFPTVVRNVALGFTTQVAGVGAILAPIVVSFAHVHPSIPFVVFASVALSNACMAAWLPETVDQPLWETIEGLERQELEAKATTTTIISAQP